MMKNLIRSLLLALAALLSAAAQGQSLAEYDFSSGVDPARWITLPANAATLIGAGCDDQGAVEQPIGFQLLLGGQAYNAFSATSNGWLRLGPGAAPSSTTGGCFSGEYLAGSYLPKITGWGRDVSTCADGYVRCALVGQAPSRTLVVECRYGYTYTAIYAEVLYQVQIEEGTNAITLIYSGNGPSAEHVASYPFHLGVASADGVALTVNTQSHTASRFTSLSSPDCYHWPGHGRYYRFEPPSLSCPRPALASSQARTDALALSWLTPGGAALGWNLSLEGDTLWGLASPEHTFTGLTPNTLYHVGIQSLCDSGAASGWRTLELRTACDSLGALPWSEDFDSAGRLPDCWRVHGPAALSSAYVAQGQGLYAYLTPSAPEAIVALPALRQGLRGAMLTFDARACSGSTLGPIAVGVLENPNDPASFVPVDTVWPRSQEYTRFEVVFDRYQGQGCHAALRAACEMFNNEPYYLMVDNVALQPRPAVPAPRITDLYVPYYHEFSSAPYIFLEWRSPVEADSLQVAYGPVGFNPDTEGRRITLGGTSCFATLRDIVRNQRYDIRLRAFAGGQASAWTLPVQAEPGAAIAWSSGRTDNYFGGGYRLVHRDGPCLPALYADEYDAYLTGAYGHEGNLLWLHGTATLAQGDYLEIYDGSYSALGTPTGRYDGPGQAQVDDTLFGGFGYVRLYKSQSSTVTRLDLSVDSLALECTLVTDVSVADRSASSAQVEWTTVGRNASNPD